jgi:hypothetical protein
MPKECAFCSHYADSREHVFSDWMLGMLPPKQRYIFTERVVKRDEYVRYAGKKIKIKAKVVCTTCNNGWMSDLEALCQTAMGHLLFNDSLSVLRPDALNTIARFAFKTLVIANHKGLATVPFFSFSIRQDFRLYGHIPDGVQIWMATRKIIAGKNYGFWKSSHGETDKCFPHAFAMYGCTWNFQNIVLQISAARWQDETRRNSLPPLMFPQDDNWEKASLTIWPLPSGNIQWPPLFYLGDDTLPGYRDRWDTFSVNFS